MGRLLGYMRMIKDGLTRLYDVGDTFLCDFVYFNQAMAAAQRGKVLNNLFTE